MIFIGCPTTPVVGHLYVRVGKTFAVQLDYLQPRYFQNG